MSNETPSPAQLLAAVLPMMRTVAARIIPDFFIDRDAGIIHIGEGKEAYSGRIDSLDTIARVVAMLDGAQRERFDDAMYGFGEHKAAQYREPGVLKITPEASNVILMPASTWLAALVAATGVEA